MVDDEDFAMLSKYHWYYDIHGYARCSTPHKMYMHRLIMGHPEKLEVDHKDHNKLNNQKSNLRVCTSRQNRFNGSATRSDNKSGFRGVCWDAPRKKWKVQIVIDGRNRHKGRFASKEEAAQVYNDLAILHYGEFAHLNKI